MKKRVKKRARKEKQIQIILTILTIALILFIYYFLSPTFIGYTILQGYKVDLTNDSNLNYNDSEIEIVNGTISLKQITIISNYTTENKITAYIESAIRYTDDEIVNATEDVIALDGNITNVDKSKIFDVTFNETLDNNDIINFYLRGINDGSQTEIYLCQNSTQCSSPGYGNLDYNGSMGWFSIIIGNLSSPVESFNIDPPLKVKVDYVNATKIILEEHSEVNNSYPINSTVTTEITAQDLTSWDNLEVEENLSGQIITYDYSIDNGSIWESIPNDKNLTNISITSDKITIKVILHSNGAATPSISSLNLTYTTTQPQTYYELNDTATISTIKDESITVNSSSSKLELNIVATESLSNIAFNITELSDSRQSALSRVKEIEILSPKLQNKVNSAVMKIYYTDEEISSLNESSLKLYYYNETNSEWQALESTVNTEENYIQANLQHFSIYGIFGEGNQQEASSSSSSSGGSGGKNEFIRGAQAQPVQQQLTQQQKSSPVTGSEETTQEQAIQTQTETQQQTTPTGNIVRIGKILATGKVNQSLLILGVILIVAYIITKIEEIEAKKKFLSLK